MSINWKKPTASMLGRYQPFHEGHKALFKEILKRTGQVIIMIRDTSGTDESNPFNFDTVKKNIENSLKEYDGNQTKNEIGYVLVNSNETSNSYAALGMTSFNCHHHFDLTDLDYVSNRIRRLEKRSLRV